MDLDTFNTEVPNLPIKSLSTLKRDTSYLITKVRTNVKTKYGQKIVLELNNEFGVYLNDKMTEYLYNKNDGDQLKKMIVQVNNKELKLLFLGTGPMEDEFKLIKNT